MRILHFVLIGCVLFLLLAIVGAIKGLKFPQGQIQSSIQGQVQIIKPVPGTIVVPNQNPLIVTLTIPGSRFMKMIYICRRGMDL